MRRNLIAGPMPTWSVDGLSTTGTPAPLVRDLERLRPELRPRLYEVNGERTAGGSLGLGMGPLGPIADDYVSPSGIGGAPGTPGTPGTAGGECVDCG
jgi:hypothetical protein